MIVALKRILSRMALAAALVLPPAAAAQAQDVTILAAASMKNALDAVAEQFKAKTGARVVASYAASSALAKQIENGAPADLFVSADLDWMDWLDKRGLIKTDSRVNLLGNDLVVIAPKGSTAKLDFAAGGRLAPLLGDGRLATGDPTNVPAGKYAKAALETLGQWTEIEPRLARTDNVRAALALVSRGEAPLGIVYRTDAALDSGVAVIASFPAGSHPPVVYPAALVAASRNPAASALLDHLKSAEAMAVFAQFGFVPAPRLP